MLLSPCSARSIPPLMTSSAATLSLYQKVAATLAHRHQSLLVRSFHSTRPRNQATQAYSAGPMRLLLLGSPGSGKGTQSAWLQNHYSVSHISSGDLLRKNIATGTNIGRAAARIMETGGKCLVPDEVIVSLINIELQKYGSKVTVALFGLNWLLDGFPRNIEQARSLDTSLRETGQLLNLVINLDVPEEVILQRIMDRWIHIPSGRVYNLDYNPPRRSGFDDFTGEPLSKRPDDNPDTLRVRLAKHKSLTAPLLEYYDRRGILVSLSGRTSDEIYPKMQRELARKFGLVPDTEAPLSMKKMAATSLA
ncbi:adenylate kinase-domain-containing protein [Endogone sp. FLAS-F59071]|nr:adenylate kinase-domain-containing protein [Endogone sp. FLAS-F59071]|eukprot:RUS16499.1 adenylate kinase-domain-containing protein [Endogone sp. FLAS-F59071]